VPGRAGRPGLGDALSGLGRSDVLVLAFVAHSREQLEELIGWLHQRGVDPDVVGGGADRPAHELALDSLVAPGDVYSDGLLFVDFRQRRAELRGRELALTPLEFRLLAAFVRHPKEVLSHDQLFELAWGDARWVSREQLRLTVSYLRRKLGIEGREAIETVRGFGYRYRPGD
jgi:DNA-binding response OmpR family regulator